MSGGPDDDPAVALAATHAWFERNSGWAPPDPQTLEDWAAEDGGRAPDECWVATGGTCPHGLATWAVVLADLAADDARGRGTGTSRVPPVGDRS